MSTELDTNWKMIGKLVLGRYRILRHLADGGMGAIYLARSEGAGGFVRPVVIKSVLPSHVGDKRMLELFKREARIMSNLRHPGIVSVIDFAQEDHMHFMVLDYVHGFHLGRWNTYIQHVKKQSFPTELAIHIVLSVLRALHYAHTLLAPDGEPINIVHRDVTPSNVLIDVEGHVKLADFGIAQMDTERTDAGSRSIKGKFPYLAPEILENADPSPASDVYSAGLVLHELLVGRNEFSASGMPAIVSRVLKHIPTPVGDLRDDIPAGLGPVVAKALEKAPANRYSSAADLADALSNVRRLSEDEARQQLSYVAARDFRDRRMAAFLSVPELDSLESDWRTPASTVKDLANRDVGTAEAVALARKPVDPAMALAATDAGLDPVPAEQPAPETVDDLPPRPRPPEPDTLDRTIARSPTALGSGARDTSAGEAAMPAAHGRTSSRWPLILGGLALAGVAAVAVAALLKAGDRGQAPAEPAYIVMDDRDDVDKQGAVEPPPESASQRTDAGAGPAEQPAEKPAEKPPRQPAQTSAQRLKRAFGRQKGKIARCFNQHAVDVSGAPELSIRFTVETDGAISMAELTPASLRSTDLGHCIEKVARATRFGRQSKKVTFRVPLKARMR